MSFKSLLRSQHIQSLKPHLFPHLLSLLVGALLAHFEPAKICTPDHQGCKVEGHVIVPLKVSLIILYNRLWKIFCASHAVSYYMMQLG